MQRPYISWPR